VIIAAYATSLLLVDRLFMIARPKLLKMPWFAWTWNWFVAVRTKAVGM
jgi:hypothetical protein